MDIQSRRIVCGLFSLIFAELPEEVRHRILDQLHCVSKSPLIDVADQQIYAILHGTLSQSTVDIADSLIGDVPPRERSSRRYSLTVIRGDGAT